jgi:hypothetical protein
MTLPPGSEESSNTCQQTASPWPVNPSVKPTGLAPIVIDEKSTVIVFLSIC